MKFSNRVYDILKYICTIAMPAVLTCVATILALCNVSSDLISIIVGIGSAVNTLLGTLLGISNAKYRSSIAGEEIEEEVVIPDDGE